MRPRDPEPDPLEAQALATLRASNPRPTSAARQVVADVAGRLFAGQPATPPAQIGRFERPRVINYGGMGVVHQAFDPMLERPVAIKLCRPGRPDREHDYQRLLKEARNLAALDHPNVVAVHEAGRLPDGQLYVALEYLDGEDLAHWLAEPRPWRSVLAALLQAARGLDAVHRAGLVHRDIKPANILRRPDGTVKLIDFGLVKETPGLADDDPPDATTTAADAPHTATGEVVGTRGYLAPELFFGAAPSPASDQFSLCVALHVGLFAARPFAEPRAARTSRAPTLDAGEPAQPPVLQDILGPYRPPASERGVPRHVVAAVRRGLSADPGARFPSIAALVAALERDPLARPARWLMAAAAVATLAGAAWARPAEAPACTAVADEVADIWSPERRAATRAAFRRTGLAHADTAFAAIDRQLTDQLAAWTDARAAACRADHDRSVPPPALAARAACLDRHAQQLRAVAVRLADADPTTVTRAPEQLAALPSAGECTSPQIAAQACHAVPDDEPLRAAIAGVDTHLAGARALQISGDFTRAIARADAAVRDADAVALRGLQARARLVLGDLLRLAGHPQRAAAVLLAARDLAQEVQCVDVLADALGRLNKLAALSGGTPVAVAEDRLAQQAALARALGPAHARLADADNDRGLVALHLRRDPAAAADAFTAAISTRRGLDDRSAHATLALADSHLNLASALARLGRPADADAALQRAQDLRADAVGVDHPSMWMPHYNRGLRLTERGEHDPAEAALRRALALADGLGETSRERTRVLMALAALEDRRGRLDAALAHARAAATSLADDLDWDTLENLAVFLTDAGDPSAAIPLLTRALAGRSYDDGASRGATHVRLADALNLEGRPAEALARASLALRDLQARGDPDDPDLAQAHFSRAEALLALAGGPARLAPAAAADARAALEAAIARWSVDAGNPARLAWSRWHLARVECEAEGRRPAARALARAARAHFAAADDPELPAEIDRWLRATCT